MDRENIRSTPVSLFRSYAQALGYHGAIDLSLKAKGDIDVDFHHTVEDVGICLGDGMKKGIGRGEGNPEVRDGPVPMDETLGSVALDLSMRPYLVYHMDPKRSKIGTFDLGLVEEFFRALCSHGRMTLHINLLYGKNNHHMVEAVFKGFGRALREAVSPIREGWKLPQRKEFFKEVRS